MTEAHRPTERPRRTTRSFVLIAVCASLLMGLLCLPFVKSMMLEDWMHHAIMRGAIGPSEGVSARAPWDFFIFMEEGASLSERTRAFWFAHPSLKVAFWRPFSSLLIAFDHEAFGPSPVLYFLHSLLWYVALCAIVAALFARLLPGVRGKLATLLFAILGTHHETVVWSAARNSIVCGVFCGLALLAHLRFREEGWKAGRWLTPVLFAVGYGSGEAALGMLGFLVAYEMLGTGPRKERLVALVPTLGVTALWLGLYVAQGYGASFSGEYISPISQPLRYLSALPERLGFTMSVLLVGMPALTWVLAPGARGPFAILGALAVVGLVWLLRGSFRKLLDTERRALAWLLLGMVLAMLPQLAGSLGPRSYLIPSFGAAGLTAHVLVHAWESRSLFARAGAGLLFALHGLLGLVLWPSMSLVYNELVAVQQANFDAMGLGESPASERSFLVVTADPLTGYFVPMQHAAITGQPLHYFRLLSLSECDHRFTRVGERTFELETLGCTFLATPGERMTRAPEDALREGDSVNLDDIDVGILALSQETGLPNRVRVHLKGDGPLPEMWASSKGRMTRLADLPPGKSTVIEFAPPL